MENLIFADTHNMVAFLPKSDASVGFDQIVDFLNVQVIQYALMVNPTIYVSCIKQFWATIAIKKINDDLSLDDADGVECLPDEEIFIELARMGYEKPPPKLTFYKAFFSAQWKLLIHTLVQCISAKRMTWNEFSCSMVSAVICLAIEDLSSHNNQYTSLALTQKVFANMKRVEEKDKVEVPNAPTPPSPTTKPLPPPQEPIPIPLQARLAPPLSPPQEQQPDTSESSMSILNTLMETCAELQGRKDDDNAVIKNACAAEPTMFDDEEMAKKLHNEEVKQAAARAKQKKDDFKKAKVLQQQYVDKQENIDWNVMVEQMQEKHLDNIMKYQSLKRKPISIAQAKKNMILYLKNMAGYKMEHFKGMTYDKVRPIFEREYNKVQTSFKPDKDVEEPLKKKVAEETLLYECFKKLKAIKVSGQSNKEKKFRYILQVIKKFELKKLDGLLAGSESRPPILNKENYVLWSSRLLRYAKSRPNGKLIHNSIINGLYVRRMILEPSVDSCETAQEIWLTVQQMMIGSDIEIQEKKAKLFNEWERFTYNEGESIESYYHHITNPTTAMNMALTLIAKAFKLNYSTPTNNNQRISSNPRNRQIAQPGMNMGQDRQMQMVGGNANLSGNGNLVGARAKGNAAEQNVNQIRCCNCRGVADLDEIKEVNANCILMANLQQASTSGTQTDKAPVNDSDRSAEVHDYENCDDNEIFNIFTQEEQYTELLESIPEQHQVPQNDNNVISEVTSVEQSGETVEQHPVNFEETRALYDSLYQNLAIKVEKVNSVNHKLKETNADLTTELARFKNQEKCFEISQEKYDKLERCYQQSVYQKQCLSRKINALHLSSDKQLKYNFKIREDELLDKQIQLEKKIKNLNNILVKSGQSIQTIHMLSHKPDSFYHTEQKMALGYQNPFYLKQAQKKQQSLYDGKVLLEKHDPPIVHDSEETLELAQESREKMKQLNKEIKPGNYTKINHLSGVKSTIVTLQRVVKHRMTLETHNWSSSAHQELHKIVKDENFPIINQVDARVYNFEIQFLKEAAKFVRDFKSLAKEADASLAKHKTLELEIERLFRAVVSQDIMSVVQKTFVVDTSNLQTELKRTKEHFENCIIKKENEYAKLWDDWYKKCDKCKYDKISYDKAYKDMQQKIEWLQAQLGDLKGKSKDTSCVSDTLNPLSQKLKNENVELEFQVSVQNDITRGTSKNIKFAKQSILGKPPMLGKINALSKPVTSKSVPTPQESKVVKNDKGIALGIFMINPFKTSREEKHVPNNVRASARTKPITVSQPPGITKKDVNSDSNGLSSTGIDNTKTRRP
uniref:Synaptobrevin, longin-like domain protein n=1 Tax=Tanacetum cinerariifolium TaxID=118510 RepID=A0A6L2MMD0_TANCI|nr:hypothetical protein [Tanacetum cinerariifolium]